MKVFAPGAYTWGNKGDAALVAAFLPWLRRTLSADTIELTSFTPNTDEAHYGVPVHAMVTRPFTFFKRASAVVAGKVPGARTVLTLWRIANISIVNSLIRMWAEIYLRRPGFARNIVPRHVATLADVISTADLTVTVPGGYLLAARFTDDWWLYHLPTLVLAKALGQKIVIGPCSVGPFAGYHRRIAARALARCDVILVREARSAEIVESLGVDMTKVIETPDLAFGFEPEELTDKGRSALAVLDRIKAARPLIGVSVRSHHFPGYENPGSMLDIYIDAVVESLVLVQKKDGAQIVIVSQTTMDVPTGRELAKRLDRSGATHHFLEVDLSPSDLQVAYSKFDLLVGTRMHANILAIETGTPVVGIAYEPKTLGILDQLGLSDWGIWIDQVGEGKLARLVNEQWMAAPDLRETAKERAEVARLRLDQVGHQLASDLLR